MVKKVVVAAAGQGTRMQKLSENKSKHLIEVNSRPFLAYALDNLILAGYKEIILVVGFKAELMEEFVKNYKRPAGVKDIKISIINQTEVLGPKEKEYGTACPIKCVKNVVGQENFVYVYGDNLFSVDDLKLMQAEDDFCYVAGLENESPEKYGVLIENKNGFLEKIIEKPKKFVGNLINVGLYKFTPKIFGKVLQIKKSERGEYEVTDAISLLAKEEKVKIKKIKNYFKDFGNPDDIEKMSLFLNEGNKK